LDLVAARQGAMKDGSTSTGAQGRLRAGLDALAKLNGLIATLLFVALTLVVALQVLTRFVLHLPFIWSEEAARFLFFWVALLGAAMSVRARRHFVLDVTGVAARSDRKIGPADLVPDACVLAFSLLLLVEGIGYVGVGLLRTASNSQVNMGLVYAAIPVFAGLSALYAAGNLAGDVAALSRGESAAPFPPAGAE
jgi:TRAP-type C4-dicarboxylate transport system permease small subunit